MLARVKKHASRKYMITRVPDSKIHKQIRAYQFNTSFKFNFTSTRIYKFAKNKYQDASVFFLNQSKIPTGHTWLRDRIAPLHYSNKGFCFGVTHTAAEYILQRNRNEFFKLTHHAYETPLNKFVPSYPLNEDIKKFLKRVALYQKPWDSIFNDLFSTEISQPTCQDAIATSKVSLPEKLKMEGGLIGFGHPEEYISSKFITRYFELLRLALEEKQIDFPIVFTISNIEHIVAIERDMYKKEWILIDANALPFRIAINDECMARWLNCSLNLDNKRNIQTCMYVTKNYTKEAREFFNLWREKCIDDYHKLQSAVRRNDLKLIEKLILKDGINPYECNLLFFAISLQNKEVIRFLLKNGFSINDKNHNGNTVLHEAVLSENEDFIKFLIECGADIEAKNSNFRTVLRFAALVNKWLSVDVLLEHGANARIDDGFLSLIELVAVEGRWDIVMKIFKQYLDLYSRDVKDVIWLAIRKQKWEVIKDLIVKFGLDVNTAVWWGKTLLEHAVKQNNIEAIRFLVENGADIPKDKYGRLIYRLHTMKLMQNVLSSETSISARVTTGYSSYGMFATSRRVMESKVNDVLRLSNAM